MRSFCGIRGGATRAGASASLGEGAERIKAIVARAASHPTKGMWLLELRHLKERSKERGLFDEGSVV